MLICQSGIHANVALCQSCTHAKVVIRQNVHVKVFHAKVFYAKMSVSRFLISKLFCTAFLYFKKPFFTQIEKLKIFLFKT